MSRVNVWDEREAVVNVSAKLRTDLKQQNLQRSREKYFSPPKKPWDFTSFSQPKRLWEISPPYRREAQKVNILSTAPSGEVPKEFRDETCDKTRTIRGLFPDNPGIGRQRWHGNALYQESPTEAQTPVQKKPSQSDPDQVRMRTHVCSPKICPSWINESTPSPKNSSHVTGELFTPALRDGHESDRPKPPEENLNGGAQEKGEVQELDYLKVQMAVLCEKLALYIIRAEADKTGSRGDVFGLKEFKLLKAVGELGKVLVRELAELTDVRRIDQELDPQLYPGANQGDDRLNCSYRSHAWKLGLCTAFQIIVWYLLMLPPVIRCIKNLRFLPPT